MANQQRNENNTRTSYLFYSFSLSLFSLTPNERRAYIYISPETHLNIILTVRFKVFFYEILSFTYPMSGIIKKKTEKCVCRLLFN